MIYGTPYIHTPTGLVEREDRTLKENLITNIKKHKSRRSFRKGIRYSSGNNAENNAHKTERIGHRATLHSNTEDNNLLNMDNLKKLTKNSILAKPDTLQVYSFSVVGGVSDQLPMKLKKNDKGVSNYPLFFLEKHQKSKFESAFTDKPNKAVFGTKHTVTTPNGRKDTKMY